MSQNDAFYFHEVRVVKYWEEGIFFQAKRNETDNQFSDYALHERDKEWLIKNSLSFSDSHVNTQSS
jgi:hypothetical protein